MAKPASQPDAWVNWSRREPRKAAKAVWDMVLKHERTLGWRHLMAQRGALAYSGNGLGDLFENLQFDGPWGANGTRKRRKKHSGWGTRSREQHARAMMDTVVEKLIGMDQPKTQHVATDADWEMRRQGIWADRWIEGNFHLAQGSYLDLWDLARQAALLCWCSTGTVAIRTEPDYVSKRIRNRLRSTLNTFIDPGDVANDQPLSYFDVTWENAEYMCEDRERFDAAARDRIWRAAKVPPHLEQGSYDGATFGTPMVKMCAAWRYSFGSFEGREALFIEDNGGPLVWEPWKHDSTPLAFYRCMRAIGDDFWGENMLEVCLDPLRDAEEIDDMAQRTMERTSQTYMHLDGAATAPQALMNAKDVNICRYDSKKQEKKVEIDKPEILNTQYFDYKAGKIQLAHDLVGVSLLHQSSEVQGAAGNRSGRSIRLEASLLPERFARRLRAWRDWLAISVATNQVRAARQIGKIDPHWQLTWSGADFDAKVSVKVLDYEDEAFTIRPYAVSEQKNTPQDRAEAAQEMYDRGEINEAQLQVINEGLYDTKRETKASTAQRRYVAKVADEMLYGDEELIANERVYMRDHYIPPMPWIDAEAAMAQLAPLYLDALIDGLPQNRRALLRRFCEDIWGLRMQQQKELAMQEASINVAATVPEAFPGDPMAAAGGMPLGQPGIPAMPPGAPPLAPGGLPPIPNAPGPPGMV